MVVIHYEEALYQVYAPLPLPFTFKCFLFKFESKSKSSKNGLKSGLESMFALESYKSGTCCAIPNAVICLDLLSQVKVRDSDQAWIYKTFTCHARNSFGDRKLDIALRRACKYVQCCFSC